MISAEEASQHPRSATAASPLPCPRLEPPGDFSDGLPHTVSKTRASRRLAPFKIVCGKDEIGGAESDVDLDEHDQVREKLLLQLREAAARMNLVLPLPMQLLPLQRGALESLPSSCTPGARTWNLRPRQGGIRAPDAVGRSLCEQPAPAAAKSSTRLSYGVVKRPRFSISLTREEIDEDFCAMTGNRARLRPRRRPRRVQKKLNVSRLASSFSIVFFLPHLPDLLRLSRFRIKIRVLIWLFVFFRQSLFPGSCLGEVIVGSYAVVSD